MFVPMVPTSEIEWRNYVSQTQETLKQDALALSSGARKSTRIFYVLPFRVTVPGSFCWTIN